MARCVRPYNANFFRLDPASCAEAHCRMFSLTPQKKVWFRIAKSPLIWNAAVCVGKTNRFERNCVYTFCRFQTGKLDHQSTRSSSHLDLSPASDNLRNMLFKFALFALHGDTYDTEEARKKCEEVRKYGTDKKEETSLWYDVDERLGLKKTDKFIWSLINVLFLRFQFWRDSLCCV